MEYRKNLIDTIAASILFWAILTVGSIIVSGGAVAIIMIEAYKNGELWLILGLTYVVALLMLNVFFRDGLRIIERLLIVLGAILISGWPMPDYYLTDGYLIIPVIYVLAYGILVTFICVYLEEKRSEKKCLDERLKLRQLIY